MHVFFEVAVPVALWGLGYFTGWNEKAKRVRRKAKRQARYKVVKVGKNEQDYPNQ